MGVTMKQNVKHLERKWKVCGCDVRVFALLLFVTAICIHVSLFGCNVKALGRADRKHARSPAGDADAFLPLVSSLQYDDRLLHKWKPAPVIEGDPNEPGYMGAAVSLNSAQQQMADTRFAEYNFNVITSDMLSLNRTLTDYRVPECTFVPYPVKLPQTSVIIVFRNEAWSTLIRTLWSIYTKSPRALLKEIILVDDQSDLSHLKQPLDVYVSKIPVRVKIVRSSTRIGLLKGRILGVAHATAPTVTFIDSHCECNVGWLEPLLTRISENRQVAVAPIIDTISATDFSVSPRDTNLYSSFSWSLDVKWDPLPSDEMERINYNRAASFQTPVMAGGIFAIDREFFLNAGAYDDKMRYWGGENLELSVRLWSCGGAVELAQCSRVAHVQRNVANLIAPGGTEGLLYRNKARMADVWMDEYSEFYYTLSPEAQMRRTDVSERLALRKRLKCKSFHWYLQHVFPTSTMLSEKPSSLLAIQLNNEFSTCMDTLGQVGRGKVSMEPCHFLGGNQVFMLSNKSEIRTDVSCLEAGDEESPVQIASCHGNRGNQKWWYDNESKAIHHADGQSCMEAVDHSVKIAACNGGKSQQWIFAHVKKARREIVN